MITNTKQKFLSLSHLVGNTPLLDIRFEYKGAHRRIFAKAENLNMTGSIKDRMALHIMKKGYDSGELLPQMTVVEATSGNTGISFSAVGRALGHKVTIFMPDWMSRERVELIQSMGATIRPVTREEGGFLGSIHMVEDMANCEGNCFMPSQFSNEHNVDAHYTTTGPEIWSQLNFNGMVPDAFVSGVGTGGTIMGVGKYLKEQNSKIKIHPVEPANSPTLSTGHKIGQHRIQGISDEFIPSIVKLDQMDDIIKIDDGDSILMAQKLASQLGLAVGISSGCNFLAALKVQEELGTDAIVATVFPDDNKKYLSTDLLREEPVKPDSYTPHVKLIDYYAYKRVCATCCDWANCTERIPFDRVKELQ